MILTTVEIEDFERFWETFSTKGMEKRREHGSRGAQVLRVEGQPHRVHVLFDWDREGFESFLADTEAPAIMSSAGLKSPPQPVYVEPARELEA